MITFFFFNLVVEPPCQEAALMSQISNTGTCLYLWLNVLTCKLGLNWNHFSDMSMILHDPVLALDAHEKHICCCKAKKKQKQTRHKQLCVFGHLEGLDCCQSCVKTAHWPLAILLILQKGAMEELMFPSREAAPSTGDTTAISFPFKVMAVEPVAAGGAEGQQHPWAPSSDLLSAPHFRGSECLHLSQIPGRPFNCFHNVAGNRARRSFGRKWPTLVLIVPAQREWGSPGWIFLIFHQQSAWGVTEFNTQTGLYRILHTYLKLGWETRWKNQHMAGISDDQSSKRQIKSNSFPWKRWVFRGLRCISGGKKTPQKWEFVRLMTSMCLMTLVTCRVTAHPTSCSRH